MKAADLAESAKQTVTGATESAKQSGSDEVSNRGQETYEQASG